MVGLTLEDAIDKVEAMGAGGVWMDYAHRKPYVLVRGVGGARPSAHPDTTQALIEASDKDLLV